MRRGKACLTLGTILVGVQCIALTVFPSSSSRGLLMQRKNDFEFWSVNSYRNLGLA